MYQRFIFYIGMLFQHVYVSAEIQKTVLLLLLVHAEMHKTHPKNNRPRHWKPNAWPIVLVGMRRLERPTPTSRT